MDFRKQKLRFALVVMSVGMLIALAWHSWEGWVLHRPYPYNTLLCNPFIRFSDLFDNIRYANCPNPYTIPLSVYFPAAYPFFHLLGLFPRFGALFGCLYLPFLALLILQMRVLVRLPLSLLQQTIFGSMLICLSYPMWFCWDRGNIELFIAATIAAFLVFYYQGRFYVALFFLLIGICFKLYPAVLLA